MKTHSWPYSQASVLISTSSDTVERSVAPTAPQQGQVTISGLVAMWNDAIKDNRAPSPFEGNPEQASDYAVSVPMGGNSRAART